MSSHKLYFHPEKPTMYLTSDGTVYEKSEGYSLSVIESLPDEAVEVKNFNDGLLGDNYERIAVLSGGELLTCTFAKEFLAVKNQIGAKVWYHKTVIDKFLSDVCELSK